MSKRKQLGWVNDPKAESGVRPQSRTFVRGLRVLQRGRRASALGLLVAEMPDCAEELRETTEQLQAEASARREQPLGLEN